MMSALTADELEVLLLTSRVAPDAAALTRARELTASPIRWDHLLDVAHAHSVAGLAGTHWLSMARSRLPAEVAKVIPLQSQRGAMSGMFLSAHLVAILKAFGAANIRAISFKGPTLAMHAYRSFSARVFGDVDVLVAPEDASRAAGILKNLGFAGWNVSPEQVTHHLRSECEETFVRTVAGGRVTCDLHWALSRGYLPLAIPFDVLWKRSTTVAVAGTAIRTPGCEDLLLYLCLHGSKHAWERLIWVCDIAELLHREPGIDWDALFARALETGNLRCLRLGLLLARDLLAAPMPAEIERRVRRDGVVRRMSESIMARLSDAQTDAALGFWAHCQTTLFHLRLRDRLGDRMRYLLGAALPNTRDREAFPLPSQLFFLHYFSRPLRLLGRYGVRRA